MTQIGRIAGSILTASAFNQLGQYTSSMVAGATAIYAEFAVFFSNQQSRLTIIDGYGRNT